VRGEDGGELAGVLSAEKDAVLCVESVNGRGEDGARGVPEGGAGLVADSTGTIPEGTGRRRGRRGEVTAHRGVHDVYWMGMQGICVENGHLDGQSSSVLWRGKAMAKTMLWRSR
jgi:hypothetical protein